MCLSYIRSLTGAGVVIASLALAGSLAAPLAGCASIDTSAPCGFQADPCQTNLPDSYSMPRTR